MGFAMFRGLELERTGRRLFARSRSEAQTKKVTPEATDEGARQSIDALARAIQQKPKAVDHHSYRLLLRFA